MEFDETRIVGIAPLQKTNSKGSKRSQKITLYNKKSKVNIKKNGKVRQEYG